MNNEHRRKISMKKIRGHESVKDKRERERGMERKYPDIRRRAIASFSRSNDSTKEGKSEG